VKVLLTGFSPWGKHRVNPSGIVALALGGHELPVDYRGAIRELRRLLRQERPDAVLMLGLAAGRTRLSLEAVALNVDHNEAGERLQGWRRPVPSRGPIALEARLPLDRIYRRLKRARLPVTISHHAGTFVCNHVFYEGLRAGRGPCGFVHVPPFKELSQARQIRAIRMILDLLGAPLRGATR
jgi:pyroglutamyl-peptidase